MDLIILSIAVVAKFKIISSIPLENFAYFFYYISFGGISVQFVLKEVEEILDEIYVWTPL